MRYFAAIASHAQYAAHTCTIIPKSHQTAVVIAVVSGEATPPRLIVKLIPNLAREV